jgi:hypothetical protein
VSHTSRLMCARTSYISLLLMADILMIIFCILK